METQTALVRTDGAVELYTVTEVHLYLALIIHPWHTESDDALRLHDAFDNACALELRVLVVDILYRNEHFAYCLQIL